MDVPSPTPASPRDASAVERMRRVGFTTLAGAAVIGAVALATGARSPARGIASEPHPNAALAILVAAAAVILGCRRERWAHHVARALGALVAALGALTLLEHLAGVDLVVDALLGPAAGATTRMGASTALDVLLTGAAVVALATGRGAGVAQTIALAAAPLPLLALVSHAYDVSPLHGGPLFGAIEFPAALALLLLDVSLLLARPDRGFVRHLAVAGTGSAIARRMLLYAVALPIALGWIALAAAHAGEEGAFAVSLVVVALTLVLVLLVLRDALVLDRMESARDRAQSEREASRHELSRALHREQDARAHAEAASRARDEFLNALSHELRTPLNAIVGWTKLLREGAGDPERLARGLAVVERNGRVLSQVVSDLLDMSRITRGVIQLEKMEVDPAAAVDRAVEAVRPAANAKGVALAYGIAPGVPPVVADPARLQQIAWNLLSNAVKFTPAGGRVDVTLAFEPPEVVLTVEDSGAGIAPAFLPHLFERFRQADGSDARRHGGLGLGLALTRELVGLHGGTIEAASAGVGRGATFRVAIPGAREVPELSAPAPRTDRPQLGGARILVVDDEADSRELLLQLLSAWGAEPVGAASSREALTEAARARPDLLLSDIAMPGEDGCAMLQELRKIERALGQLPAPAIALTAFGRPDDRRRVLAAGFDVHLSKPVEPDELRATIAALLRREPRTAASQGAARPARPAPAPAPVGAPAIRPM